MEGVLLLGMNGTSQLIAYVNFLQDIDDHIASHETPAGGGRMLTHEN